MDTVAGPIVGIQTQASHHMVVAAVARSCQRLNPTVVLVSWDLVVVAAAVKEPLHHSRNLTYLELDVTVVATSDIGFLLSSHRFLVLRNQDGPTRVAVGRVRVISRHQFPVPVVRVVRVSS